MQRVTRLTRRDSRWVSLAWAGLAVGLFAGIGGRAGAQAPAVISTYDKVGAPNELEKERPLSQVLGLRANVTESIYLYARAGAKGGGPYTAKLLWKDENKPAQEIASAAVPELGPNSTSLIRGWKLSGTPTPTPNAAPGTALQTPPAAAPAPKAPPGPEFTGLSPVLEIQLVPTKAGAKPLEPQVFNLQLERPTDYLTITGTESASAANFVTVKIKAKEGFHGPPCKVSLDVTGFKGVGPKAVRGVLKGKLKKAGEEITLYADFRHPVTGDVSVTADDWTQADRFHVDLSAASARAPDLESEPNPKFSVVTALPLYEGVYCSRPLDVLPIQLQVYTPKTVSREGSVTAWFDFNDKVGERVVRTGSREQHIYLLPPKDDGALLFQTEVHDWALKLDTPGTTGMIRLNGELYLQTSGRPLTLTDSKKVLFTDTPPTDIRLAAVMPTEPVDGRAVPVLIRGKPLVLRATAKDEAGIAKAMFFLGKVGDDNKLPAGAVPGKLLQGKNGPFWEATLPLPEKLAPGPLDVGVMFTDNVGLSDKEVTVVLLKDPVPLDTTIEGDVREGDLLQPDLKVELRDDKNVVKATTKTKPDGHYRFTKVVPGAYRVYAEKLGGSHGDQAVEIQKGEQKKGVDLTLLR